MQALVTGASGFIGPRLLRLLNNPLALSRDPNRARTKLGALPVRMMRWDPLQGLPPP